MDGALTFDAMPDIGRFRIKIRNVALKQIFLFGFN
jgi:hypothetical protein